MSKGNGGKKKMGRPRIDFTEEQWGLLDAILQYKATLEDCAGHLGCSEDTVENRVKERYGITFSEYRDKKMSSVRLSLQQKAIQQALSGGNNTMLIFCLKNMCGWSDKQSFDISDAETNRGITLLRQALSNNGDRLRKDVSPVQN